METISAIVETLEAKQYIKINARDEEIRIPMSEDNSNEIKKAFNKLIEQIRNGELQIELQDIGEDLISQVAKEYIKDLNREIKEVYSEMAHYDLLNE